MTGRPAAFFDVDRTLIEVNSGQKWIAHEWQHRRISLPQLLRAVGWLVKYRFSLLDFDAAVARAARSYAGRNVAKLDAEVEAWYHEIIAPTITVQGKKAIEDHRSQGHHLVLLSSGMRFSLKRMQDQLGVDDLLCTELEIADGHLTGHYFRPACYGPGKLIKARALAQERGLDLSRSYFYTDSFSDKSMLEVVGCPRVINPDPRLKVWAVRNGHPIEYWTAP